MQTVPVVGTHSVAVVEPPTSQLPLRTPGAALAANTARTAITSAHATTAAHWWPQYDEPVYRQMFEEQLEQLAAGLRVPEGAFLFRPDTTAAVTA